MSTFAISVLAALRDGPADDWYSLCQALEISHRIDTRSSQLAHTLRALADAELILLEDDTDQRRHDPPRGRITLSHRWEELVNVLGLSLSQLTRLGHPRAIVAMPSFEKVKPAEPTDIFVVMPFSKDLTAVYQDHIREVAVQLAVSVSRADDLFTTHHIMQDIWSSIFYAKVVIADCTGRNPNVFYELGLAHAIGKPVILITQSADDVPSDIRHIRYLHYSFTPAGMKEFEQSLSKTIRAALLSHQV